MLHLAHCICDGMKGRGVQFSKAALQITGHMRGIGSCLTSMVCQVCVRLTDVCLCCEQLELGEQLQCTWFDPLDSDLHNNGKTPR
jgi:hypothetical protein